jgi:hypothetical protein
LDVTATPESWPALNPPRLNAPLSQSSGFTKLEMLDDTDADLARRSSPEDKAWIAFMPQYGGMAKNCLLTLFKLFAAVTSPL